MKIPRQFAEGCKSEAERKQLREWFKGLNQEQRKKLDSISDSPEMQAILDPDKDNDGTESVSMLGGQYTLGGREIPAVTAGLIPLLCIIDSPFVGGEDNSSLAIIRTLYVVCTGREAVQPIMAIEQRLRALKTLEKLAKQSSEHWQSYLDYYDSTVMEAWTTFDKAALEFWTGFPNDPGLSEAAEIIDCAIADATGALEMLPQQDETQNGEPKKKRINGILRNIVAWVIDWVIPQNRRYGKSRSVV